MFHWRHLAYFSVQTLVAELQPYFFLNFIHTMAAQYILIR